MIFGESANTGKEEDIGTTSKTSDPKYSMPNGPIETDMVSKP
jgi:hypothetical protein